MEANFADGYLTAIENASAEERAEAFDRFGLATEDAGIVTRSGGKATISISGPLSPEGPSPLARFFGYGGTAYNDIVAAADSLAEDAGVTEVLLAVHTPGGTVDGMDGARQAIKRLAASKPVVAENHGLIASAGYYLVATPGVSITAVSPLAKTGSVGVILAGLDFSSAMERNGIKKIRIVSKNAPNKAPDPATTEGRDIYQEEINASERVFIRAVAEGRGTTDEDVITNFGKGGTLIAEDPEEGKADALSTGMIDSVINGNAVLEGANGEESDNLGYNSVDAGANGVRVLDQEAADGGEQTRGKPMDINQLKTEHPALFAEAVSIGTNAERERVEAHVTMGEASGDTALAIECIKNGAELSASINAKYMAAGMKNNAIVARTEESEGDLNTPAADADAKETALAKATAEALGVEIDG
jgi:ClpP class serine protease